MDKNILKRSGAFCITDILTLYKSKNKINKIIIPKNPNSSPIIGNMKSV